MKQMTTGRWQSAHVKASTAEPQRGQSLGPGTVLPPVLSPL